MSTPGTYLYYYESSTTGATSPWLYGGEGSYFEKGHDGNCIKVDKGQPDKAQHVIFYAEIDESTGQAGTDPMIFCKDEKELEREMKKLMKRSDVAKESIRIFNLSGGIKKS